MTIRNRPTLVTIVAVLAVALLAVGGTAAASGAAKTAAKNSVTSKSIKNGTVSGKDLKDGSVTSADLADGSVGSTDLADGSVGSTELADGSVGSGDVADDGLTGADIAEATLSTVPNATAVGGVQITPLALSLPATSSAVPVLTVSGNVLSFDCGPLVTFRVSRAPTGPPTVITGLQGSNDALAYQLGANEIVDLQLDDGTYTVGMVTAGGGSVTAAFTAIFETNAIGSNDCFYRGTVTRTP
jgi:cytoskeletal protein RodZ